MFGKRLAELRTKMGLSQYELADRLKFSRGQIANYEQGTREPDFKTLIILSDFFHVSLDYLLGRTNVPNHFSNNQEMTPILRNIAFFGENKEELTENEAEYLKESLQLYRKFISKHQ